MKHLFIFLIVLFSSSVVKAQYLWDFGGSVGATNYLGDIGGGIGEGRPFVADIKLSQTRWNVGGFARFKARSRLSLRASVDYIRLEGNDALSLNPARKIRNFNFKNDIYDMAVTGHLYLYDNNDLGNSYRYRHSLRFYVFAGIGGFYSNPKTNYKGSWVALRPLQTEGVAYKSFVMDIPMGAGMCFTFNKKHRFGFEINYRKTFTDYLDDISGDYRKDEPADAYTQNIILRKSEFDRSTLTEEEQGIYDSQYWGGKRGNPKNKDTFITMSFSYSYVIKGKSSFYKAKSSPYYSKKRRVKRVKAKF